MGKFNAFGMRPPAENEVIVCPDSESGNGLIPKQVFLAGGPDKTQRLVGIIPDHKHGLWATEVCVWSDLVVPVVEGGKKFPQVYAP